MSERYILECIKYAESERGTRMGARKMFGLTTTFDMAYFHVENLKKDYDVILIHPLHPIDNLYEEQARCDQPDKSAAPPSEKMGA